MKILLSIKPQYVERILNGTKRFEFRKVKCKNDVDSILIYETAPVMRVVREARINGVIEDTPDRIWERTRDFAGISKPMFDSYFQGADRAVAYVLSDVVKYDNPRTLGEYGIRNAPQSFVYVL